MVGPDETSAVRAICKILRGGFTCGPTMPVQQPSSHFLFVVASGRRDGNSEQLARRAALRLPAGATQQWIHLADFPLPVFTDARHGEATWQPFVEGPGKVLLEATLAATAIVIVAPVYWYSLPASAKLYLDHWTTWLRSPGINFKARMAGKTLHGISVSSDGDPTLTEPVKETLRLTAGYLDMHWGGFLLGAGNRPGQVMTDAQSVAAADSFFLPTNLA